MGRKPNVAKMLQAGGYQTAMVGEMAPWVTVVMLTQQVLTTGMFYPAKDSYYDPVMIEESGRTQHDGYATDIITDFSLDWLKERDREKPFFLMCHHKAPHRPWDFGREASPHVCRRRCTRCLITSLMTMQIAQMQRRKQKCASSDT